MMDIEMQYNIENDSLTLSPLRISSLPALYAPPQRRNTYRLFIVMLLLFAACIHAKTRDYSDNNTGHGGGAITSADIENRLRPYFENKVRDRRGARQHRAQNVQRPTQQDLFTLMRVWEQLSPSFRELYKTAISIPADYKYHISPAGKFKIFYTTSGEDSVNTIDTIGYSGENWRVRQSGRNDVPDYIDEVAFALDSAWSMLINRFEFVTPINTPCPNGNTDYYLVLVNYQADYYGVTYPNPPRHPSGVGFPSHIEINSDWSDSLWHPLGYHERPYDAVRITAAHEFMHSIQYSMVRREWPLDDFPIGWIEGVAVLMEDIAFPEVKDYLQYLSAFFRNPRTTMFLSDRGDPYVNSILLKYIYEKANPVDSIGFIRTVHFNNYPPRRLPFNTSIENASQEYANRSWAELLNAFHAESYFTGNRARRPWAFVSDAERMGRWTMPAASAKEVETQLVAANTVYFLFYEPHPDRPDTLKISIRGERDLNAAGNTWGASVLIMETVDSARILPIAMGQDGSGGFTLAGWKEKRGALLVVTNAGTSQRRVTVTAEGFPDIPPDTQPNAPLRIAPNVVKISEGKPIRISGGNITEIKILASNGNVLGSYTKRGSASSAIKRNADGVLEWHPDRRLVPGVYYITAVSNKKRVLMRKIMVLP